jgi:glycosyltransferase involved in cell wall biosynthesis
MPSSVGGLGKGRYQRSRITDTAVTMRAKLTNEAIRFSVIVPCFNEEQAIPLFYNEAVRLFSVTEDINDYEFVFVDDGSGDRTINILRELSDKDSRVHYISFSRNFGKEAALLAGMQRAQGQYVVTMDVDGQDPLWLIPQMLKMVMTGEIDCVGTRRVTRRGEPLVRSFFARCFYALMAKISDIEVMDGARDFRLMNRSYVEAILSMRERNRFSKGIFPWVGFKTKWLEYENIKRLTGISKWSFWKLFLYSFEGIVAFSTKPLAIASVCGLLFCVFSVILAFVVAIRKFVLALPDTGWSSTVCLILFTSGMQLFCTGILGQYLARTYTETKKRPHYIIRETR